MRLRGSFHVRLLVTLSLTLAAIGGVQYLVQSNSARHRRVSEEKARQAADAAAVRRAWTITVPGEVPVNSVNRYLRAIEARPGIDGAELVDGSGATIAAGTVLGLGVPDPDSHVVPAIKDGRPFGGEADDFGKKGGHLIYVTPVKIPGPGMHALVVRQSRSIIDGQIAYLRRTLVLLLLGGGLLAVPLFYLLGGRSLGRLHRAAVERALRDGLTDLPNHRAFQDELDRAVALATRHGEALTLCVIDVDDFRFINDRHGHGHADSVLQQVAEALGRTRKEDRAFRIGGDEFALLLPRTGEEDARYALGTVTSALGDIAISLGIAGFSAGVEDADGLRAQADAALFEAQRRGGARAITFSQLEDTEVLTAGKVRAIRRLLSEGDMDAAYQPIFGIDGDDLLGYEGLARPAATYGINGPGEAFEIAGAIGRSAELDEVCRRAVLDQANRLPQGALLFVNVAPQSLDSGRIDPDALARHVRAAGLEPDRVVLEVTERFSGQTDRVVAAARRMREVGFKLALDDVGAGNSGLQMLRQLELDFVKVDREVIVRGVSDITSRAVLVSVLAFAGQTGAFVIAEGIEDQDMWDLVRDPSLAGTAKPAAQGVQGFLFGRPGRLPGDGRRPPDTYEDASAEPLQPA